MPVSRVTQSIMVTRALNNLNNQTRKILDLQTQLATGLKVNSPSDDPLAARRAVNIRATLAQNTQYGTNISSAQPVLQATDSALESTVTILQRANELTLQAANGTNAQSQLDEISAEVNQLLESTLVTANTQSNGRYIFGGTRTTAAPFVATRDAQGNITAVTYNGNDESVKALVAVGTSVTTNVTGTDAFAKSQDVFQMLIHLRDNLTAGDSNSLTTRLTEIRNALAQSQNALSKVGAVQNRLDLMSNTIADYGQQLQATLSDNIDADYAQTVTNLNAQSNAYQAALSAVAKVIQPSLLDYVK